MEYKVRHSPLNRDILKLVDSFLSPIDSPFLKIKTYNIFKKFKHYYGPKNNTQILIDANIDPESPVCILISRQFYTYYETLRYINESTGAVYIANIYPLDETLYIVHRIYINETPPISEYYKINWKLNESLHRWDKK